MGRSLRGYCLSLLVLAILPACGGGGGGGDDGDFIGAALVAIDASPQVIDTGDRTQVEITIEEVHEDGIMLKVFYPGALDYVPNSAFLEVDDSTLDVSPSINQAADTTVNSGTYLVFFFPAAVFGEDGQGVLTFELEARDLVQNGEIGVDADVDDPAIENPGEFDISNPEFRAEDSVPISVRS